MGSTVTHSLSPVIHKNFAAQFKLNIDYKYLQVNKLELNNALQQFVLDGGAGANITAPLKELILTQIPHLSKNAQLAGAVNTITVKQGVLYGDNTDGIGFIRDISKRHGIIITNARILILGAGGAARGLLSSLLALKPQAVFVANRDPIKTQLLINNFQMLMHVSALNYNQIGNHDFDLIINTTSVSLDQFMPANFDFSDSSYYDLNYLANAANSVSFAISRGAVKAVNGLGMLVEQAAESFYLWHGLQPDTDSIMVQLHQNAG